MKLKTNLTTLLFLMFVSKSLAQDATSREGNEITFTCVSFTNQGEIRINVVSVTADGSNPALLVNQSTTAFSAMATFTVTPSDEKAAYCEVGDMSTDLVYFGASPILEPAVTRLLAIVGSEQTLECPYELGTASNFINPYHHIWFKDQSNDIIPEEFNRTLNVAITEQSADVTTYTCALRMRECSVCDLVVDYPSLNAPQFQVELTTVETTVAAITGDGNSVSSLHASPMLSTLYIAAAICILIDLL